MFGITRRCHINIKIKIKIKTKINSSPVLFRILYSRISQYYSIAIGGY